MMRYFKIFQLFFLQAIKIELTYRSQILQRLLGLAISMSATIFFWIAVSQKHTIADYTPQSMLFYFVIVTLQDFVFVSGEEFAKRLGEKIRMGKLSSALVQPFPYLLNIFASGIGGFALRISIVLPFFLMARWTFLQDFRFEDILFQFGFYLLAFLLACAISLVCLIITGLLAFDMTHVWAPWVLFVACYLLLSGIFFPADQATGFIKALMPYLPFYYMQGFPALVLVGRLSTDSIFWGLAQGALVLVYLSLILTFMWHRGVRKFEAIGI